MKTGQRLLLGLGLGLGLVAGSARAAPMGTAFTYQGVLVKEGTPVTDACTFDFSLWDAASGGNQIGSTLPVDADVTDGQIQTTLDFGAGAFNGDARWLEIVVQCPGDQDPVTLSPRIELTPAPYAIFAANGPITGGRTPLQIAQLAWYEGATFNVGTSPRGVAFDGANIWVTNFGSDNVTKLRASDGAVLGTFSVGTQPCELAFDGANIWVTNGNTVTKLRASDGVEQPGSPFDVGLVAIGVAFDGANIWVANQFSHNVTKLRASDGALLGTFSVVVNDPGPEPYGVAFDGANIWVTNSLSDDVTKLRASDGAVLGTFSVGSVPLGVAFDGTNIWVVSKGPNTVTKL